MSLAGGCQIREAEPGVDDDAVAALMVDYLNWAIEPLPLTTEWMSHPLIPRWSATDWRATVRRSES